MYGEYDGSPIKVTDLYLFALKTFKNMVVNDKNIGFDQMRKSII